ncbi:MAG: hypothetical protein ACI4QC_06885, partial [Thermoguttaceae bacterium]
MQKLSKLLALCAASGLVAVTAAAAFNDQPSLLAAESASLAAPDDQQLAVGQVRLRDGSSEEPIQEPADGNQAPGAGESAPAGDEGIAVSGANPPAEAPSEPEPETANPEIQNPELPVPNADGDSQLTEEEKAAAQAAQGENVPAEDKLQALRPDDADAPDARVRLTEMDVTPDAVQATAQEQANVPVENPVANEPVVNQEKRKYGHPYAEKATRDMSADLLDNLRSHGGAELYARWRAYNASIRSRTNSLQTGNELNNRCRLRWYEALYQDPLNSVNSAEEASRVWADNFMGDSKDVLSGVRFARARMDVSTRGERPSPR